MDDAGLLWVPFSAIREPVAEESNGHGLSAVELSHGLVDRGPVKPTKAELDRELGVPSSMPFGSFTDWMSGQQIAANVNLVSLDQLIEMRQKDGTVRALISLLTLPIVQSLKEAEFVAPEEPKQEEETPVEDAAPDEEQPDTEQAKLAFPPAGGGAQDPAAQQDPNQPMAPPPPEQKPPLPPEEVIVPEVEFCNQMFNLPPAAGGMSVPITKLVRQILLGVVEGFSAFEVVVTLAKKGPLKGKYVLQKLSHRDSRTIQFLVDDNGGFAGLKQIATRKGERIEVVIEPKYSWYWAAHEEENPFYGVSFFEAAWHHWDIKRKLYYITHIAAQMAAVPGRMGTVPRDATPADLNAFLKMLGDFAFNTAGVKREGFEVEFANQNTGFNFLALIDHQNAQMAKSVLAKFLEDPNREVLIDNSAKDVAADFFVMTVQSIMDEIAEHISHYLVPKFIDWNFGSEVYPEFHFGAIADSSKDAIKELFTVVATAQSTQWTPEFIREMEKKLTDRLGLDVDYDAVEGREQDEAAKQAELEQAYFQTKATPEESGTGASPGSRPTGGFSPEQAVVAAASAGAGDEFVSELVTFARGWYEEHGLEAPEFIRDADD